jgi:hypothetical protein
MNIKKTAANVGGWLVRRARERSTWLGLTVIATAIGGPAAGLAVGKAATIAGAVLGGGLVVAPTSDAPQAIDGTAGAQ